jgi:hypothetical protein
MAKEKEVPQTGSTDPMANRPTFIQEEKYELPEQESSFYPRIKLIQALSPEMDDTNDKYIPAAKNGQLLIETNPPTLVDSVVVVPLMVKKRWAEYIPKKQGGGFVASYDSREAMEAGYTQGNDVAVVIEYLCVLPDTLEVFVVPFGSPTALGVAKKWGAFVEQYKTLSGVMYKLSSKTAKNKADQPYKVMVVEPVGWVSKQLMDTTKILISQQEQLFLPAPDSEV